MKSIQKKITEWDPLFPDREEWKEEAFNKIKQRLFAAKDNRWLQYGRAQETHLVSVFGKTQVGKTTLILNMIGIKESSFEEVYHTLRAKVPLANSSTSAATVYFRSDDDMYRFAISRRNETDNAGQVRCNKEEMICRLQKLRDDAENNRLSADSIISIGIPGCHFIQDKNTKNISILDLPGINSRNTKEKAYVEGLMREFISLSSVCIIVCKSHDIQSLETMEIPGQTDWKNRPRRFIIAVTNSYNDGQTKKYFDCPRGKRNPPSFYDYVTWTYDKQMKKILGASSKIEVFPVDIGKSFHTLRSEEIKDAADRMELTETLSRMLSELREAIISRRGERLESAINSLVEAVDLYGENESNALREKAENHKELKKVLEKETEDEKEKKSALCSELAELEAEKGKLQKASDSVYGVYVECKGFAKKLSEHVIAFIRENSLYKESSKGDYLYLKDDEKEAIINELSGFLSHNLEEWINRALRILSDNNIKSPSVNMAALLLDTDNKCYKKLYGILGLERKGIFSKKIYIDNLENDISGCQDMIDELLQPAINGCIGELNKAISESDLRIREQKDLISVKKNKIDKLSKEISECAEKEKVCLHNAEEIEIRKKQDRETLDSYRRIVADTYSRYRDNLVDMINKQLSPEKKLLMILLLGTIDSDYKRIVGDING